MLDSVKKFEINWRLLIGALAQITQITTMKQDKLSDEEQKMRRWIMRSRYIPIIIWLSESKKNIFGNRDVLNSLAVLIHALHKDNRYHLGKYNRARFVFTPFTNGEIPITFTYNEECPIEDMVYDDDILALWKEAANHILKVSPNIHLELEKGELESKIKHTVWAIGQYERDVEICIKKKNKSNNDIAQIEQKIEKLKKKTSIELKHLEMFTQRLKEVTSCMYDL